MIYYNYFNIYRVLLICKNNIRCSKKMIIKPCHNYLLVAKAMTLKSYVVQTDAKLPVLSVSKKTANAIISYIKAALSSLEYPK